MVKHGNRRPKIEPDLVKELHEDNQRPEHFISSIGGKYEQMKQTILENYKTDVEKYCIDNPNIAVTRFLDYINMQKIPKIKSKDVKIEKTRLKEEETIDVKDEKTKELAQKIKKEGPGLTIPDVIRTKKGAFRLPNPHEVLFSINGTPITVEVRSRNKTEAPMIKKPKNKGDLSSVD